MRVGTGQPEIPRDLTRTMALLAVAAAVCVSVSAGGVVVSTNPSERRITAETDEAVATFMACLNEAAKTFAGQTATVVETPATAFDLAPRPTLILAPSDDRPVVSPQPQLSWLNLPPPAAVS